MEDFELVKENVQPLKQGRVPAKLRQAVSQDETSASEKQRLLAEEQRNEWMKVQNYAGDDPLKAWLGLISWTEQSFPSGNSNLLALLEQSTRELMTQQYRNDLRYLKLWIKYADKCKKAGDIFNFLEVNDIGQDFDLFYFSCAVYHELSHDFQKAHEYYELGIHRNVEGVEHLRRRFKEFETRMAQRVQRQRENEELGMPGEAGPSRQSLKQLSGRTDHRARRRAQAKSGGGEGNLPGQDLEIFEDPGIASHDDKRGGCSAHPSLQWDKLPSQQDMKKENEQHATAWAGVRMPQKRGRHDRLHRPTAASTLPVFEDEECLKGEETHPEQPQDGPSLRLRLEQRDGGKEDNPLLTDPLLFFKNPQLAPSVPQGLEGDTASTLQAVKGPSTGFSSEILIGADGEECCFEEARAARWMEEHKEDVVYQKAPEVPQAGKLEVESDENNDARSRQRKGKRPLAPLQPVALDPHTQPVAEVMPAPTSVSVAQPPSVVQPELPRANSGFEPTVNITINTREAFADIMSMFGGDLPSGSGAPKGSPSPGYVAEPAATSPQHDEAGDSLEVYEEGNTMAVPNIGAPGGDAEHEEFALFQDPEFATNHNLPAVTLGVGMAVGATPVEGSSSAQNAMPRRLAFTPIEPSPQAVEVYSAAAATLEEPSEMEYDPEQENMGERGPPGRTLEGNAAARVFQPLREEQREALGVMVDEELQEDEDGEMFDPNEALRNAAQYAGTGAIHDDFIVYGDDDPVHMRDVSDESVAGGSYAAPAGNGHEPLAGASRQDSTSPESSTVTVDPFSEDAVEFMMAAPGNAPLHELEGVFSHGPEPIPEEVTVVLQMVRRGGATSSSSTALRLGDTTYLLKGCLGSGAYAQVYEAYPLMPDQDEDMADDDGNVFALKVQSPACPWEYCVLNRLQSRLPEDDERSAMFLSAHRVHVYPSHSMLLCDFAEHGSLQGAINAYLSKGLHMDEVVVMYYTIEMLHMMEAMHACGIVHADFKPDNLMLRNGGTEWEEWAPWRPGSWKEKGLMLIDFGKAIDTRSFPDEARFVGDSLTDAFRCMEMLEGRPWKYQADLFGLAGVVHCMLHGRYMEVQYLEGESGAACYAPQEPLKRYWQTELWGQLFETLLNPNETTMGAPTAMLANLREMFEMHLVDNHGKMSVLRQSLMKQTIMLYNQRNGAA
ncbi:hypothetical protein CYMTET_38834 [Cymbomonas tetramitiformis]|uniref:Bub1 n=1 Tax=Cymbomonas tetramitiformis TaxID=36881 RepID=A0AAE0F4I9_9CHLO|nr:hypothetical protein CYMTET_38834 [Cymbomonas tetramitiformis]